MSGPSGEMPFLDHLEELRSRILRSLVAVVVAFVLGLWLVQRFQLVSLLKTPIAPYLTGGKLIVTSPTEPVMIVFKLGFLVALVLASPVILWQTWAFLAPALYAREKRALVPSLFVGLVLFLTGMVLAYLFVVPQALRVLFSFQTEAIAPFITYDAYFGFVLQVTMALGISFELPLVIIILSWLGVIGPSDLNRFRRFAVVLAFIAGAVWIVCAPDDRRATRAFWLLPVLAAGPLRSVYHDPSRVVPWVTLGTLAVALAWGALARFRKGSAEPQP